MFIKIAIKEDAGHDHEKESAAYSLVSETFQDLVFCGNLAGYVEAGGSFVVIRVGGLFGEGLHVVRDTITEIWKREDYPYSPDDLLEISIADSMLG